MSAAEARRRLLGRLLDYDCTHTDARLACDECTVDALLAQANRADLLEAAGGERVRHGLPGTPLTMWSCSHDGPSPTSRANWCDLGCGRDYNRMTEVDAYAFPAAEPDRPAT